MTCIYPVLCDQVYNGRDNVISLVLSNEGSVITDLSSLTRATITIGATTIDSDVVGSTVIWWTDTVTHLGVTTDVLKFKLGGQSLTAGEYTGVAVVIYDSVLTSGARLLNALKITVYD